MIEIILIGVLAVIVITIAQIEIKDKEKVIECLNTTAFSLHERNFELAHKLEDAYAQLNEERETRKNLENTILMNGQLLRQQRYDVVHFVEHIDIYHEFSREMFEGGELTAHGRKVAISAFKGMINDICADENKFDALVDVYSSFDQSGVDVSFHMVNDFHNIR